jgi:hypothetical protein
MLVGVREPARSVFVSSRAIATTYLMAILVVILMLTPKARAYVTNNHVWTWLGTELKCMGFNRVSRWGGGGEGARRVRCCVWTGFATHLRHMRRHGIATVLRHHPQPVHRRLPHIRVLVRTAAQHVRQEALQVAVRRAALVAVLDDVVEQAEREAALVRRVRVVLARALRQHGQHAGHQLVHHGKERHPVPLHKGREALG